MNFFCFLNLYFYEIFEFSKLIFLNFFSFIDLFFKTFSSLLNFRFFTEQFFYSALLKIKVLHDAIK